MARQRKSTFTVHENRSRQAIEFGIMALAATRGVLMVAFEVLPPTDSKALARMEAGEIPWTLTASLWRDLDRVLSINVEEALAELQSSLEDDPESLAKRWESAQA